MTSQFSCNSYVLHLFGPFPASSVRFEYDPRDRLRFDPSAVVEKDRIITALRAAGKTVHILPLYRFRSLAKDPYGIVFHLGHTDFGEYLLTDISHPEQKGQMASPISISAVTETADHTLLLGCRSPAVIGAQGMIQMLPGGYIHPPDILRGTVEKELHEELAVTSGEIAGIVVTGFAQIRPSEKPEILLHVLLDIPLSEILGRQGADRWEFTRIFSIHATRDAVTGLFTESGSRLAPASHAALAAYAFHAFGIAPAA